MGYKEAVEDSIPMERDSKGFMWYYPTCSVCGGPVSVWRYVRGINYICPECKEYCQEQEWIANSAKQISVKERRLEIAIKRISKVTHIELYEKAIAQVRDSIGNAGWYQSTEEVMVALELLRRNICAYHQVKIYNFRVDFILPELCVALEIDGKPFHGKEKAKEQAMRDELIISKLGEGWQVIHIDSENIDTNVTRLVPAIRAVLKARKKPFKFT